MVLAVELSRRECCEPSLSNCGKQGCDNPADFIMNARFSRAGSWMFAVGSALLLLTGCQTVEKYSLTYRVWDTSEWAKFSEPAPNPNLALFETSDGRDVLVEYDALSEKRPTIQRRAYYLRQNHEAIASGSKPKFLKPLPDVGLKRIEILPLNTGTNLLLLPGVAACVIPNPGGHRFTLHRPKEADVTFELPVYSETSGTITRIVLTPLAVAGDTVMVGGVAVVVGFILWVQSGAPTN